MFFHCLPIIKGTSGSLPPHNGISNYQVKELIALPIAKEKELPREQTSPIKRFLKRALFTGAALVAIALILLATYVVFWPFELKTPERTTNILADDGQLLTSIYVENRRPVPLSEIAPEFLDAVIAVEDSRFYQHRGIDFIRLGKAILVNIQTRSKAQGASTITQQLARNLYLTLEKKYSRKIMEAILALQLEQHLTKDEILELYVNQIYYGHGLYGIQNAARFYYGKDAADLTLAQSTMLAGIIRVPEVYSPINDFETARKRQRVVLNRMVATGKLTPEEADAVFEREDEVRPVQPEPQNISAGYVRGVIVQHLSNRYLNGAQYAYKGGLTIQTTINRELQAAAEAAVKEGLDYLTRQGLLRLDVEGKPIADVALVALDPKTGEIKAMVGGKNYRESTFNRVYAKRPPGSTFKPIMYAEALRQGKVTLATPILCAHESFTIPGQKEPWEPKDFGGRYHDRELTVREAIAVSDNVIAAKVMRDVGPTPVVELAKSLGIPLQAKDAVLSLALGTVDISPLELAVAFATFANQGQRVEPLLIRSIQDPNNRVWESNSPKNPVPVLDERITWLITNALKDVVRTGTGTPVRNWCSDPRVAAKTGTTGNSVGRVNSAWLAGYTPDLVTVVYIGADDYEQSIVPGNNLGGGTLAGAIWGRFMGKAQQILPNTPEPPMPEGIVKEEICTASGEKATFRCPEETRTQEYFLQEYAPDQGCSVHGGSWFDPGEDRPWWEILFPNLFRPRR